MKKQLCLIFILTFAFGKLMSQSETEQPLKFVPKELNISSSAVFELMGVTPSQIAKSSDVKDFKVDWSFKSWRLNPNIALQGQPIWELFYSRKSIEKYQKASWFGRTMASLDVSVGTVQNEQGDRRIGFGGKLNLYKSKDPMLQLRFFDETIRRFNEEISTNKAQIKELKSMLDTVKDVGMYRTLSAQLISLENERSDILSRQRDEVIGQSAAFSELNWNTSFIDIGGGSIYTYKTDSVGSLKKLSLNRNTGYSGWVSAGFGLGRKWLISGLARTLIYDEQINFTTLDTLTLEEFSRDTVIGNNLITLGLNIRYGSPYFNLFVEYYADLRMTNDKFDVVQSPPDMPPGQVVIGETVSWNVQPVHSITLGGDWRMGRNVMLNFGLRMEFDAKWNKQTFIPVTTLVCLMR
ncbi:MAG: hypothetical protein HGA37_07510 [Lentimicrobium sp.]|nr:hypothetical protein [Lentimicrobium sp.]